MKNQIPYYFPLARPFFFSLFLIIVLLIVLIQVGILGYAYEKIGISQQYILTLLLLSFFGSYVNIPVAKIPAEWVISGQEITYFGVRYIIPRVKERRETIIAINVGGAIIPTLLSLYLLIKNGIYWQSIVAVVVVAVIVYRMAKPIPGMGIAVPILIPPLVAAVVALLLSGRSSPPLAYIAGSPGTLIGGDLLNLSKIKNLRAPVASIGGAGTFDGIFLAGILAVLLA
jgi:uncharacterized membrane protein